MIISFIDLHMCFFHQERLQLFSFFGDCDLFFVYYIRHNVYPLSISGMLTDGTQ